MMEPQRRAEIWNRVRELKYDMQLRALGVIWAGMVLITWGLVLYGDESYTVTVAWQMTKVWAGTALFMLVIVAVVVTTPRRIDPMQDALDSLAEKAGNLARELDTAASTLEVVAACNIHPTREGQQAIEEAARKARHALAKYGEATAWEPGAAEPPNQPSGGDRR